MCSIYATNIYEGAHKTNFYHDETFKNTHEMVVGSILWFTLAKMFFLLEIPPKFVKNPIDNNPALVQTMVWSR